MANTPRSEDQLDALFLDNDLGDISAQDGRDFIATFFGHKSNLDPTPDNDRIDSAGIGAFFSAGSRWLNTATQIEWVCYSGAPHLAIWQPAWNGAPPMPGPTSPMIARLTSFPLLATALASPLLPCTITNGLSTVELTNPSDIDYVQLGMLVNLTTGMPPGVVNVVHRSPGPVGFDLTTTATATTATSCSASPWAYEWVEQAINPVTSAAYDKPGGIIGTITTAPAINVWNQTVVRQDEVFVELWFRGIANGIPVYEFELDSVPDPNTGGPVTGPIRPGANPAYPAPSAPGSLFYDPFTFLLYYINISGSPLPVTGGLSPNQSMITDPNGGIATIGAMGDGQLVIGASGLAPTVGSLTSSDSSVTIIPSPGTIDLKVSGGSPGVSKWVTYTFDNAHAITIWGGQWFFVLAAIPANRIILRIVSHTTIAWVNNFNPVLGPVKSSDVSLQTRYNQYPTAVDYGNAVYSRSGPSVNNVEGDGTYSLAAGLSTSITPSAGQTSLFVEYIDL